MERQSRRTSGELQQSNSGSVSKDVIIFGTEEEKTDDDDQNNENKDENGSVVEENNTRQTALWPELSSQEFKQSVTSLK